MFNTNLLHDYNKKSGYLDNEHVKQIINLKTNFILYIMLPEFSLFPQIDSV